VIAVSNSSPLIILARVGCFQLLNRLFSRLIISPEVYREVVVAGKGLPGAAEVVDAIWIETRQFREQGTLTTVLKQHPLGAGELSAILLAKECDADVVLLDDHQARQLAKREGLSVLGTVGLLEAFYVRGHLPDLSATFRKLLAENAYIDRRLLDRRLKLLGLPAL
jgi:predicted nucleic acid-binding protein